MYIFIGRKGSYLPGVPARDLTIEEVLRFGEDRILKSGLYRKSRSKPKASEDKAAGGGSENKEA